MQPAALFRFAATHHGLVSWKIAREFGMSRSSWQRFASSLRAERLYPNVVRINGAPVTAEQLILAAVWAAGDGAMASHRSAAFMWGVDRPVSEPIDVMLPNRNRHSLPDGVVVHRPRDVRDLRSTLLRNVPTTNPLRMLLDLGAVDADGVEPALISILSRRVASPAAIRTVLARHSRRGRHGVVALRGALENWLEADLPPDSELEVAMAELLRTYGLPPVTFHARVAGFEVDFLVTDTPVVIECDGWGVHGLNRNQFEFDRVRNAELVAAGYVLVHVTWRQVMSEPAKVAQRIRAALSRWAPQTLSS